MTAPTTSSPASEWGEDDFEIALILLVMLPICCACLMW